jgi:hypothetical protein
VGTERRERIAKVAADLEEDAPAQQTPRHCPEFVSAFHGRIFWLEEALLCKGLSPLLPRLHEHD